MSAWITSFLLTLSVIPSNASSPSFSRLDSLFLIASTGEPRFQSARDSCERILVSLGVETLDYLVASAHQDPAPDRTPRQRHYVERLFTVIADSGRNPVPREALARAIAAAPTDTLRARWLYIGSRIGDSAFRATALPWLNVDSEPVRRMAARALGAYPQPKNIPLLFAGIDTLHGAGRHARLWALEAQAPLREWKRLFPLLTDPDAFNRRKVRDLLLKSTDSSWAKLHKEMPQRQDNAMRREWRLLALDAKGGRKFLEKESAEMTVEERMFFGFAPAGNP